MKDFNNETITLTLSWFFGCGGIERPLRSILSSRVSRTYASVCGCALFVVLMKMTKELWGTPWGEKVGIHKQGITGRQSL